MRGKQSGITFGHRNQRGQSDTSQLISIANYIRKRWHMNFKREWYVGFDRGSGKIKAIVERVSERADKNIKWRNPDLLFIDRRRGLIIIEVDGSIHDRKVVRTQERNDEFRQANAHLIVLNLREIKNNQKKLEDVLDFEIQKTLNMSST